MHDLFLIFQSGVASELADVNGSSNIPVIVLSVWHHVLGTVTDSVDELVSARSGHIQLGTANLVPRARTEAVGRELPPVNWNIFVGTRARVLACLLCGQGETVLDCNLRCGLAGAVHPRIVSPAEGNFQ